jgi:predicted amidohydrolase YtcJ
MTPRMPGPHPRMLIRGARLVAVGTRAPDAPVDIRMAGGIVRDIRTDLRPEAGEHVIDAGSRWAIPGLWDEHVHMKQWAQAKVRVDLSGTAGPSHVTRIIADHIATLPADQTEVAVQGYGYRTAAWNEQPTVSALDAVSGEHPIVLVSGDVHNGWLNSRALKLLGLPSRDGPLEEGDWFPVLTRLGELPGGRESIEAGYRTAVAEATGKGIVGIVDLEFEAGYREWAARFAAGIDQLRVRPATYPDGLEDIIGAGLASGSDLVEQAGMVVMGPLKIIFDGSLNTRTAYCFEPYADGGAMANPRGALNYTVDELTRLLRRARDRGMTVAVHAIGDAALASALDVFEATGARGSIEHAQLVRFDDLARMSELGVRASVQPAHLLDDRDVTMRCWPDRAHRCFAFRSMLDAGVTLRFGSDAPVAPLDPWLAMATAVHRSSDGPEPWNPAESLAAAEALMASAGGQTTVAAGRPADVVLLDADPLAAVGDSATVAKHLREMPVAATFVGGRMVHRAL